MHLTIRTYLPVVGEVDLCGAVELVDLHKHVGEGHLHPLRPAGELQRGALAAQHLEVEPQAPAHLVQRIVQPRAV